MLNRTSLSLSAKLNNTTKHVDMKTVEGCSDLWYYVHFHQYIIYCTLTKSVKHICEIFTLLICYAAYICSYRRFGTIYQSHFKGQAVFLDCLTLQMGPVVCPETSVTNYQSTLRNIPEERRSHLHRGESLKSREAYLFLCT
jgi:hypothetical protein